MQAAQRERGGGEGSVQPPLPRSGHSSSLCSGAPDAARVWCAAWTQSLPPRELSCTLISLRREGGRGGRTLFCLPALGPRGDSPPSVSHT